MKVGVLEILSSFIAAGDLNYPSSVLNDPSRNPCQAILIALYSPLKDDFLCDPVMLLPTLTWGRREGEIC